MPCVKHLYKVLHLCNVLSDFDVLYLCNVLGDFDVLYEGVTVGGLLLEQLVENVSVVLALLAVKLFKTKNIFIMSYGQNSVYLI